MKKTRKCGHAATINVWSDDGERVIAARCSAVLGCGEYMPLGPANDDSEAVQIEIRAAELSIAPQGFYLIGFKPIEKTGWRCHERGKGVLPNDAWHAGWLAREIAFAMHDINIGWSWDPSRPVAGQYEEWLAKQSKEPSAADLDAIAAQNQDHEPDSDQPDCLAACFGCEVPFGCRDGHCMLGKEGERSPMIDDAAARKAAHEDRP